MLLPDLLWRLCLIGLATARPGPYPTTPRAEKATVPVLLDQAPPVNNTLLPDTHDLGSELRPRAPAEKPDPLGISGRFTAPKLHALIKKYEKELNPQNVAEWPPQRQLDTWKVTLDLPQPLETGETQFDAVIGVTSKYVPWPNKKAVYKFGPLTGCTGTFVLSQQGFWSSHHWETIRDENNIGGASFQMRIPPSTEKVETPEEYFKKMNCDILTEVTPPQEKPNREFESLADVQLERGAPFARGGDVDIHIMTKAETPGSSVPKYANNVEQLKTTLQASIRESRYDMTTYAGGNPDFVLTDQIKELRGWAYIMFTPFEKKDKTRGGDCGKVARAVLFIEDDPKLKIDLTWETD